MTTTIPPDAALDIEHDIAAASERIAPTWPLDQFIAVNPYWGWRGAPVTEVAARLGVLAGTRLTMPRAWFREEWAAGRLAAHHIDDVAASLGDGELAVAARKVVEEGAVDQPPLSRFALITDLRDVAGEPGPVAGRTWSELVVHQIGQHCAAHFDEWQASWAPSDAGALFATWRTDPSVTHGFRWRRGSAWARSQLATLPSSSRAAIATVLDRLGIRSDGREAYLTALLVSVNGWAAWCAHRRWQARLVGGGDDAIVDLLAIRVVWEWLLATDADLVGGEASTEVGLWAESWCGVDEVVGETVGQQQVDWVLQNAVERTHQDTIIGEFRASPEPAGSPDVQAVFCIDVRSEVFRRSLESAAPSVHTRGFAGFFGVPISYTPVGGALTRPHLPGLLAPAYDVSEASDPTADRERQGTLAQRQRWSAFRRNPSSVFSFVETMGGVYGVKLIKESLPHRHGRDRWELDGLDPSRPVGRPRLSMVADDPSAAAALAHRILSGMGLVEGFAPIVMLCGHGSQTKNNPHAAGLDCGACGGQTGEVNARVVADLLNDARVRDEVRSLGVDIPATTWFLPALHNTTTDAIELFDTELAPPGHGEPLDRLRVWLVDASDRARAERSIALGLGHVAGQPDQLERTLLERADDWSQVRPEWGLAGNAAFVVAPRSRTRHIDLQGRCFLHDYDWRLDPELSILTSIMTAPMVVTNWINMQYLASTVDNGRYGSGNKVLHNVVGGRIGVFEGNGGDLRIGLPMQSLHDGHELRHRPLRLSVFVEAPAAAIDAVIAGHQVVQDLVGNGWIHLLRIDPASGSVERRTDDGWASTAVMPGLRGPSASP